MTGGVSHSAVQEVLPWYVNGTASAEEREMVARHLEQCEECREELTFLTEMSVATSEAAEEVPAFTSQLQRTLSTIDTLEQAPPRSLWARAVAWLGSAWSADIRVMRMALVTQFALILVMTGVLVFRQSESSFGTLSDGDEAGSGPRLTVMFQPAATEESIRQVLVDVKGTIVSGPSALGVYVVELPAADRDPQAIAAAVGRLRNTSSVIRFVEQQP